MNGPFRYQLRRARYLLATTGFQGVAFRGLRRLLSPIYLSDTLVVTNLYIDSVSHELEQGPGAVNGQVIETLDELDGLVDRLHGDIDIAYLRDFLGQRPGQRFVLLLAFEKPDGSARYVGFRTVEQGYFEMPEYRIGGPLNSNVGTVYEVEVVAAYRGRGIHGRTRKDLHRECWERGMKHTTGVTRAHNVSSLRSGMKQTPGVIATYNGSFRVRRWLGGLWIQAPPWSEIRQMLESPPGPRTLPQWLQPN